jgi:SpoVK/Ycf46/Vps4 family AAA+-type ATPase
LDSLISSYLGETAGNVRKIFEFAQKQPCVLFLDEFDALARSREDTGEHNELRRVVNSLLLFIDRIQPRGFLVAATNLDKSLDPAVWRRFDEVVWFDKPDRRMAERYLAMKFKNVAISFDPPSVAESLEGFSYAEIERACVQAMKAAIIARRKQTTLEDFRAAVADEKRRRSGGERLAAAT